MGAISTSINPSDFANRLQTFFNPKLEESLQFELHYAEFAQRQKFPAHGTSIRYFRARPASTSSVVAIAEGVTPTNITEVGVGYVDVPLSQLGALSKITDIVQATDLLNTVQLHTKTLGRDAALKLDTICRDALITGLLNSDNTFANRRFERFAGVANTGVSATDWTSLTGLSKAAGKINRLTNLGVITEMKRGKVPMINGQFVAVTPAEVLHDMYQDPTWITAAAFDVGTLYKRARLKMDGVVFTEAHNAFIEDTVYGTFDDVDDDGAGLVYSTVYLGEGAFGVPELANDKAGSNPYGPKLIILANPDKNDPLNLLVFVGWKTFYGCKPLIVTTNGTTPVSTEVPRYAVLRSKSTFQ